MAQSYMAHPVITFLGAVCINNGFEWSVKFISTDEIKVKFCNAVYTVQDDLADGKIIYRLVLLRKNVGVMYL